MELRLRHQYQLAQFAVSLNRNNGLVLIIERNEVQTELPVMILHDKVIGVMNQRLIAQAGTDSGQRRVDGIPILLGHFLVPYIHSQQNT